jgi:hypothetical protein
VPSCGASDSLGRCGVWTWGDVASIHVISLDAATVLLQWSTGGMLFCWFTTRGREVGLGYGWMLRITYLFLAIGALWAGVSFETVLVREAATVGFIVTTAIALGVSVKRRAAGVSGQRLEHDRRTARVAAMTGIDRTVADPTDPTDDVAVTSGPEFPPLLDLVPVLFGTVGLVAGALDAGGNWSVAVLRTLVGAAFLGAITDAMLLGHWYLVQPGLPRRHLNDLVRAVLWVLPLEVIALLLPVGMIAVLTGEVDDGWNGVLGWFWVACVVTTAALCIVTRAALKERSYSAVMAATGLLYLAILTAFGTDLVARAVLA